MEAPADKVADLRKGSRNVQNMGYSRLVALDGAVHSLKSAQWTFNVGLKNKPVALKFVKQ
jgi:hypothetical protein